MSIGWIGFSNICKTDLPGRSLRLFLYTSRLWKRIPALPTGKSNRWRTRFFYRPINISSRNLLSFRQMAPLNQSPWDRTTDETRLTEKKYSTNCTSACVFDIIRQDGKILQDLDQQVPEIFQQSRTSVIRRGGCQKISKPYRSP